jgi:hypothetical protein
MRKVFALRIVKAEYKVLYVVVACGIAFAIASGLIAIGLPRAIEVPIALAMNLCVFLYGARVFRGPNEIVEPPRPWWRMTAGKGLSFLLGFLFSLMSLVFTVTLVTYVVGIPEAARVGPVALAEAEFAVEEAFPFFAYFVTLAVLYWISYARIPNVLKLHGRSSPTKRTRSARLT